MATGTAGVTSEPSMGVACTSAEGDCVNMDIMVTSACIGDAQQFVARICVIELHAVVGGAVFTTACALVLDHAPKHNVIICPREQAVNTSGGRRTAVRR